MYRYTSTSAVPKTLGLLAMLMGLTLFVPLVFTLMSVGLILALMATSVAAGRGLSQTASVARVQRSPQSPARQRHSRVIDTTWERIG